MKNCSIRHKAALLFTSCFLSSTALAGPNDVIEELNEPVGELQPHHTLSEPAVIPPPPPPPAPPPADDIAITSQSGIVVSDVQSSYESVGILSAEETSFSDNIWQYLDINETQTLLSALPQTIASHRLREQIIQLLELSAQPPRHTKERWLITRADMLAELGRVDLSQQLLAAVPPSLRSHQIHQALALRSLQLGDAKTACEVSKEPLEAKMIEGDEWDRFAVFCHAITSNFSKAGLMISLKQESQTPYPAWFTSLVDSYEYQNSRIKLPDNHLDGMDLAMMLQAGSTRLPKDIDLATYIHNKPETQWLIGHHKGDALAYRIQALEALGKRGYVSPMLSTLYEQQANRSASKKHRELLRRASAYNALSNATSSKQAIKNIASFLKHLDDADLSALSYTLLKDPITALSHSMKRQQQYVDFAPQAFGILMHHGKYDTTHKWLDMMDINHSDAITTYVAHELVQFANHAGDTSLSADAKELPPFILPENAKEKDLALLHHFYAILDAFTFTPPSITQQAVGELLDKTPHAVNQSIVSDYAARGSVAGVLLSAASQMGSQPLEDVPTEIIIETISALQQLQQYELAKTFAIESVLARF